MARASLVKFLPTIYCAFLKFKHFDNSLIISDNLPHCVRRTANSSLMDLSLSGGYNTELRWVWLRHVTVSAPTR